MQLLPMASSPDGLISARYAVITKTPGWEGGLALPGAWMGRFGANEARAEHLILPRETRRAVSAKHSKVETVAFFLAW